MEEEEEEEEEVEMEMEVVGGGSLIAVHVQLEAVP